LLSLYHFQLVPFLQSLNCYSHHISYTILLFPLPLLNPYTPLHHKLLDNANISKFVLLIYIIISPIYFYVRAYLNYLCLIVCSFSLLLDYQM
jgi:hypothetical protein